MVQVGNGRGHHRMQIGGQSASRGTREQAHRIPSGVVYYLCSGMADDQCNGQSHPGPPQEQSVQSQACPPTSEQPPSDFKVRKVMMKPLHHEPRLPFALGRMEQRGGCYQLMMNVEVQVDGASVESWQ